MEENSFWAQDMRVSWQDFNILQYFIYVKIMSRQKAQKRIFNCLWNLMIPPPLLLLLLLLLYAPPTPISDHGTREVVATLETLT